MEEALESMDSYGQTARKNRFEEFLVSVVIPCFNGAEYVAEAVNSALAQTWTNKEIIVVNDGSTDESLEIISQFKDSIKIINQRNSGLPAARNSGIRNARGKFLAFLDADDYWDSGFLEKSIRALIGTGADISYCGWQNIGLPGPRGKPYIPADLEKLPNKLEMLVTGVQWPVHCALIKRDILDVTGCFDEHLKCCEDFAFWLKTATRARLVLIPEVLAYYRHHPAQMTKNKALVALNHWHIQQEYFEKNPNLVRLLGERRVREISEGELLRRGYYCYWARELAAAREIFRVVMRRRYGGWRDWKYMLPSLLPEGLHRRLISILE
jgi:glycosyltransferase involved in cell wall biosynthesis